MSKVEALRARLTDKARDIRNCPDCAEGWIHYTEEQHGTEYPFNHRCHCHRLWQEIHDELKWEFSKLKKAAREQYPDLITPEMTNWHSPSIPDEEIVSPERQGVILRNAALMGNRFAQWKIGMGEERERW